MPDSAEILLNLTFFLSSIHLLKPMPIDLETGLPSVRQVQTLTREETEIELKLLTGDLLTGKIRWQDPHCICLIDHYDQPTVIWRHAIAYLKPKQG